jgi:hypothetical protein
MNTELLRKILNIVLLCVEIPFAVILVLLIRENTLVLSLVIVFFLVTGIVLKVMNLRELFHKNPVRKAKKKTDPGKLDQKRQAADQALAESLRESRRQREKEIDPEELQEILQDPAEEQTGNRSDS